MSAVNIGTIAAYLKLDMTGFSTGVAAAETGLKGLASTADASLSKIARQSSILSNNMFVMGGAMTAGLLASEKAAASFQRQMELLHTQAGASQAQVDRLTKSVLALAPAVGTGPEELAKSLYHIVSVGVPAAQQMNVLKIAAEGAKVGLASTEETTNALASTMVSGIKGITSASQAMAELNAIVGAGNMRMSDLNGAISTGLLSKAKVWGLTIQDVGAALATLTDSGMNAQEAATRLGMSFTFLGVHGGKAREALRGIGMTSLQLADDMQKPNGLIVALRDFNAHLVQSGKTASEQAQIIAQVFGGGRSGGAIMTLLGELDRMDSKYSLAAKNVSHYAEALAASQKEAAYQTDKLKASMDVLAIEAGQDLLPQVNSVVEGLTGMAQKFNELDEGTRSNIVTAAEWTAGILLVGGAGLKIVTLLGDAKLAWEALTGAQVAATAAATAETAADVGLGTSLLAVGGEAGTAAAAFDAFAISTGGLTASLAALGTTLAGITIPAWLGVGTVGAGGVGAGYLGLKIAGEENKASATEMQMAGSNEAPQLISHIGQMERELHGMTPGTAKYKRLFADLGIEKNLLLKYEGKAPGELNVPRQTGPGKVPQGPGSDAIVNAARRYGLDERAMAAVAMHESGLNPGELGDYGIFSRGRFIPRSEKRGGHATSFGLFQLHQGGALGNLTLAQALNPEINALTAARGMSAAGARGLTGMAAIRAMVTGFEHPANPEAEIADAAKYYYHGFGALKGAAGGKVNASPLLDAGAVQDATQQALDAIYQATHQKLENEIYRAKEQENQDIANGVSPSIAKQRYDVTVAKARKDAAEELSKKETENEHKYLHDINEALKKRHEQLMTDLRLGAQAHAALQQQVLDTEAANAEGNPLKEYMAQRHRIMVQMPNGPYAPGYYADRQAQLGSLNRQYQGQALYEWMNALGGRLGAMGAFDAMTPGGTGPGETSYLAGIPAPSTITDYLTHAVAPGPGSGAKYNDYGDPASFLQKDVTASLKQTDKESAAEKKQFASLATDFSRTLSHTLMESLNQDLQKSFKGPIGHLLSGILSDTLGTAVEAALKQAILSSGINSLFGSLGGGIGGLGGLGAVIGAGLGIGSLIGGLFNHGGPSSNVSSSASHSVNVSMGTVNIHDGRSAERVGEAIAWHAMNRMGVIGA